MTILENGSSSKSVVVDAVRARSRPGLEVGEIHLEGLNRTIDTVPTAYEYPPRPPKGTVLPLIPVRGMVIPPGKATYAMFEVTPIRRGHLVLGPVRIYYHIGATHYRAEIPSWYVVCVPKNDAACEKLDPTGGGYGWNQ